MREFISWDDFERVDLRVGTVIKAEIFPQAKKPAFKVWVDLGPLGVKKSSAQLTQLYTPESLLGQQVICVVNLAPRQIGPFFSEVLITGLADSQQQIVLIKPDKSVPNGARLF